MERCIPIQYGAVFCWAMTVLLGMIGLGRLVALAVGGDSARKAGWGLHAVWGAGVYLFVGGLLGVFGLCGQIGITLVIGLGFGIFIWTLFRGWRPAWNDFAAVSWSAWPAFAVVALTFATGLYQQTCVSEADDFPAYFNFCDKLLETGSFGDPFSWRRLASLGGHTLLQCSVLAHASWANAQAFEVALCPAILLGLILGFRKGALARSWLGLFLGLIAVTTPILRANTTSHLTGVVFAMGLFSTLDLIERGKTGRRRLYAVAGMVAAGLCTLRAPYIPAACGAIGLFWLGSWMKERRPLRKTLIEAACWGGSLFVALLPWMIMAFVSSGSPLFPLFQGNNNLAFNPQRVDMPFFSASNSVFQMIVYPAILPLLLCLLAALSWRSSIAARAVSISAVLTSLVVAYGLNLAPDAMTIPRYVQPLLLASALGALITTAVSPGSRFVAAAIAALLPLTSLSERGHNLAYSLQTLWFGGGTMMPASFSCAAVCCRDAQALIPEGKRALVCVDFPFVFDHRRNPIWIIDFPNAASPPPGLPFRKPPEEMKRYLRDLGVDYIIFQDFSKGASIYSREYWEKYGKWKIPLLRIEAPYCLDFFDTIDRLASSEATLGRAGNLTVIQLKPE
jgi:hypothetical protein